MQDYISLRVISNEKNIPAISQFIAELVGPLGFSEKRTRLICFAVESILDMRFKQISADNPFIEITVSKNMEYINLAVRDKGLPYILTENQRNMLRRLADGYRLEQLASEGQRLLLMLKPKTEDNFELPHMEEEALEDAELSITGMNSTDEDINEAVKCMYSAYGYEYIHQALYKIEHFRDLINDKSFLASMVRNAHGQVLGMGALVRDQDFPGLYEVSNLATKKYARGHGVAKMVFNELLQKTVSLDAEAVYCCPVAFHTATQKLCEENGMTPCGFILQGFPPNAAGGFRDGNRRLDYALCANIIRKDRLHILYLADEIKPLVTEFFDAEQVAYTVSEPDELPKESRIVLGVDSFTSTASVVTDECGADFGTQLTDIVNDRDVVACEIIMLFLNVSGKGAISAYKTLRSHGFIFTGSLPGSVNGDYVIMQRLQGQPFRRDRIQLTPRYSAYLDRILRVNEPDQNK